MVILLSLLYNYWLDSRMIKFASENTALVILATLVAIEQISIYIPGSTAVCSCIISSGTERDDPLANLGAGSNCR